MNPHATAAFHRADVYGFAELLTDAERAALLRLRGLLDEHVRPVLAESWDRGEFPADIDAPLAGARLMDPIEVAEAGQQPSSLYAGFRTFEIARVDASVLTWYNAQAGLFRTTVAYGAAPEQAEELDARIRDFSWRGVFALTEPDHGSDIAGGLATSARRNPATGHWTIDGAKRWIGGAGQADVMAVFARDADDGQIKCFLVPTDAEGVRLDVIHGKASLRIMQNYDITLTGVVVDEAARLPNINSWKDVAACLRRMRADVAWSAAGVAAGAYEAAVDYVGRRGQFGQPLARFALIQEKLAHMLGNVTASLAMVVRLSQRQAAGIYRDEDSSLAKMHTARTLRETTALAREVAGGNGILLANDLARYHADAEALYSYEGTHEINALVVARSITGIAAFR
ncbi:acyl-CoA dehydrogenase family protein [Arthrobacter sp. JSM 101049]|uniref:acyl-CoA dehydrogenase family protein n=1 Tax=Arthrobacter sp. JSM 101049 TaxID=929097 RepID=UPI00356AA0EA